MQSVDITIQELMFYITDNHHATDGLKYSEDIRDSRTNMYHVAWYCSLRLDYYSTVTWKKYFINDIDTLLSYRG